MMRMDEKILVETGIKAISGEKVIKQQFSFLGKEQDITIRFNQKLELK